MGERDGVTLSAMAVWLAVIRTKMAFDSFGRRSLDHLGLGLSDFVILESVLHVGPITPSQLGERVGLTRGSITSAVDRLAAKGLVMREPNAADARSSLVKLTQAGTMVIRLAWQSHTEDVTRVVNETLTPEERAVLFKLLGRLRREVRKDNRGEPGF